MTPNSWKCPQSAGIDPMMAGNNLMATGNDPVVASARVVAVVNDRGCYHMRPQLL